ncbi:lipoyl(octanoyl) transferase LipB [Omnitrophica bacterium]|nr:lipoyl(octanoyl) transferase LipB [Candidatus Omnitrophota bacterium]
MIEICQSQEIVDIIDIGIAEYRKVYDLQKELVRKRWSGIIEDTLVVTEHLPVFTIGRTGSKDNLLINPGDLAESGIDLIETDRGGDITFHGPGQLVLYPILDLSGFERDIRAYIKKLEEVIIDFLSRYNIAGLSVKGARGVWIDKNTKIGSIGVGITKWISYHGLSVNVNTTLGYFNMIRPCGLKDCMATSISSVLKKEIEMTEAKRYLVESFKKIFKRWRK